MSSSDRRPAERTSATLSNDQSSLDPHPLPPPADDSGPVELPVIVQATLDHSESQRPTARSRSRRPLPAVWRGEPGQHDGDTDTDPVDSWVETDHRPVVVPAPTGAPRSPLRVVGRRPRVRKVTRVVRHLDPWSVFKVGLVFAVVLYGVALTSGVLLWNVALGTGTIDNVERWFTQFGWETFEMNGGEIFHNAWIAGLFGVVALTGFAVLVATLFNLVSDMVGGVRVTVLEEEVVERTSTQGKRFVVRRLPADGPPSRANGMGHQQRQQSPPGRRSVPGSDQGG